MKFTLPWNSAAHNCKSSLRECLFEYDQPITSGAHLQGCILDNYLSRFCVIFSWSHDQENVTSCSFSQGVRRTPGICVPAPDCLISFYKTKQKLSAKLSKRGPTASLEKQGPCAQGRDEVRWRPGQKTSLVPPWSNLSSFGSKFTVLKKVLVIVLGLFVAPRSDSAPP